MLNRTALWDLVKASVSAWFDDSAPSMGAALSFYAVFSLAPLVLIAVAIAGVMFGADAARGEVVEQLRGFVGDEGARAVQSLLRSAGDPGSRVAPSILGGLTFLFGATSVFVELQNDLDRVWRVPAAPGRVVWLVIRSRLLSVGLILTLSFLLLASLVISAALAAAGRWWGAVFGGWEGVLQIVNLVVSFMIVTALFALIYKVLPRVAVAWRDVWIGAVVTAILVSVGRLAISLYLGTSGISSGFGAAGSIAAVLVWVYYSAQLFLLGAEFSWVYAHRHGSRAPFSSPHGDESRPEFSGGLPAVPSRPARRAGMLS